MFTVALTNFGLKRPPVRTLAEAIEESVRVGFETTIIRDGQVVGSWSPIGGYRSLPVLCETCPYGTVGNIGQDLCLEQLCIKENR